MAKNIDDQQILDLFDDQFYPSLVDQLKQKIKNLIPIISNKKL